MKKILIIAIAVMFGLSFVSSTNAWGPCGHWRLAARLCQDDSIKALADQMGIALPDYIEATNNTWGYHSVWSKEPPKEMQNNGWNSIRTWQQFKQNWGGGGSTNQEKVSQLIHIIADCCVPDNHCPACESYTSTEGENFFEIEADFKTIVGFPSPRKIPVEMKGINSYEAYYNKYLELFKGQFMASAATYNSNTSKLCTDYSNYFNSIKPIYDNNTSLSTTYSSTPGLSKSLSVVFPSKQTDLQTTMYPINGSPVKVDNITTVLPTRTVSKACPIVFTSIDDGITNSQVLFLKLGRQLLYTYLYCYQNSKWDNPPFAHKDVAAILGLLLND